VFYEDKSAMKLLHNKKG